MDKTRSHVITHSQVKSQIQAKRKAKSPFKQKRQDLIPLKEAIFSLSPLLLKDFLDMQENEGSDDLDLENDIEEKEMVEIDADMEIADEDEMLNEIDPQEANIEYENSTLLDAVLSFDHSPVFQPHNAYTINISKTINGLYKCSFEGPAWFYRRLNPDVYPYVVRLIKFLDMLSGWLESEKQIFLKEPSPETFAIMEESYILDPIVLQNGFLSRINGYLPEKFHLDETAFSRLLDKIWLLWPNTIMPLKHLFTKEFRIAWLMETCTAIYKTADDFWHNSALKYPDLDKKSINEIKNKCRDSNTKLFILEKFEMLDPEEKLHLLRDRLGFDNLMSAKILKKALKRINEVTNGAKKERA